MRSWNRFTAPSAWATPRRTGGNVAVDAYRPLNPTPEFAKIAR